MLRFYSWPRSFLNMYMNTEKPCFVFEGYKGLYIVIKSSLNMIKFYYVIFLKSVLKGRMEPTKTVPSNQARAV